jgi:malonyl CoA-acyl carrier protein transacylase
VRTLLLFDGLGGTNDNLLPALRRLYAIPENAAYFQAVFEAADQVMAYLDPPTRAQILPDGLPLRHWFGPAAGPAEELLRNSVSAGLCVLVLQACHLQPARHRPDEVAGSLGHSIGLLAAMIAGLRLRRMDEFLAVVSGCLRLLTVTLVRGHQLAGASAPGADVVDRYRASVRRGAPPGPMASLSGLPRDQLREAVDAFNAGGGSLSVSLANSPDAHVLSGRVGELLQFYFDHEARFDQTGVTWTFLTTTIPFHSPHLDSAVHLVGADRRFIGDLPSGDMLRLPVYATDGPRNLQGAPDLAAEFLAQVLVRPIEWEAVTRHAVDDAAVDLIVDYGPGSAARRFARECLRGGTRRLAFEPFKQFFAAQATGGQHAVSALSRSGRAAQRYGS